MKFVDMLSGAIDLFSDNIDIYDLTDLGACVSVTFGVKENSSFRESISINTPYYRRFSHMAFHLINYDESTNMIQLGSPVEQPIRIMLDQEGKGTYINPCGKPIFISNFLRMKLNKILKTDEIMGAITKNDIGKCIQLLEENKIDKLPKATDISSMIVYNVGDLTAELINNRIYDAVERSKKPGYNNRMLHYAVRDFMENQICQYVTRTINGNEEINEIDVSTKIILPEYVRGRSLINNRYVAVNDSPQSEDSGRVVHLLYNVYFDTENKAFGISKEKPFLPVSILQATSPYFRHTFSNRMQVRRASVTQSLGVMGHNEPLVTSKYNQVNYIPGVNLHTAFMQYGFTVEDGIIVSKSAAQKLVAAKIHEEVIECIDLELVVEPLEMDPNEIIKNFRELFKLKKSSRLIRKGVIGRSELGVIRTTNKKPSIVFSVQKEGEVKIDVNTGSGIKQVNKQRYVIRSVSYLTLETGDKLSGFFHGNKGTVAKIIADEDMPIVDGERVEVIMDPSICKRGIPGLVMECYDSIIAKQSNQQVVIDPNTVVERNYDITQGRVKFDNKKHEALNRPEVEEVFNLMVNFGICEQDNVLHGWIRMTRLDHNSSEKLSFTDHANIQDNGTYQKGSVILPGVEHVLYSANCEAMLRELFHDKTNLKRLDNYLGVLGMSSTEFIGRE